MTAGGARRAWVAAGLAVASGAAYAAALPPLGWWPLGWVCLLPLMWAVRGRRVAPALALGAIAGWTYAVLTGWWVWVGAHYYFGASRAVATLFIALVVGPACGVGIAAATALAERMAGGRPRIPRVLAWPIAWAAGETLRVAGPVAMPWCLLAATQLPVPLLLQAADLGGPALVGVLLVAAQACVAEAIARPALRRRYLAGAVAVCAGVLGYGALRFAGADAESTGGAALRVAVIQGNIPQQERWLEGAQPNHERVHTTLTYRARAAHPDVVIWPETAAGVRRIDRPHFPATLARLAGPGRTLVAGCIGLDGLPGAAATRRYNVVVGASPDADARMYRKRRLVPFGEAVPGGFGALDLLGMRRSFPEALRPGPDPPALLAHAGRPIGAMICYEFLFPRTLASTVRAGAEWIVILSNDAWYDTTPAPAQHHAQVALAAVAARRPIVRATNTGYSGGFDAWGRPLPFEAGERAGGLDRTTGLGDYHPVAVGTDTVLPVRTAGWALVTVRPRHDRTLFTRCGNWPAALAWLAVSVWGIGVIGVRFKRA